MKFINKKIVIFTAIIALAMQTQPTFAQTTELPAERLQFIRANCRETQNILDKIQRTDLVTRTVRGRAYQSQLDMMAALNSRFALHKVSAPGLTQLTADLKQTVDAFRDEYQHYTETMIEANRYNCQEKPAEFYSLVERARAERARIAANIVQATVLLDQYRNAIAGIQANLPNTDGGE